MDLQLTAKQAAFRDEVRVFLEAHMLADIAARYAQGLPTPKVDVNRVWQVFHEHGWAAPAWPVEHGGRGLTLVERHIFDMECRRAHVPPLIPQNVAMIGPALIRFGSEAQKSRFLSQTLSGEIWWTQGYSESEAGSDLANVKMKATRDGDDYLVTGTKMWTTLAESADWIFCLVRSDPNVKPQRGISFLLIDLKSDGVEINPIIGLNGERLWSQVILENVRVPIENRLGEENEGWTVAKALLGDERIFVSRISESTRLLHLLKQVAGQERCDGARLIDEADFKQTITELDLRLQALDVMGLRLLDQAERDGRIGAEPSAMKALGSPLVQAMDAALVDAMAYYGGPDNFKELERGGNEGLIGPAHGQLRMHNMLHHRGYTIAGGTTEIQKNIIAKAILGL